MSSAHHTHYYQRLLSLGLNHKQVTLLEYLVLILLGVSAVVYFKAGEYFPVFISACWITMVTLAILKIRDWSGVTSCSGKNAPCLP